MDIITRHWLAWPVTWTMLKLFQFGMFLSDRTPDLVWKPYAIVFIVLDVLYNWTIGAFIFWERPFRTNLFTDRLEEHKWWSGRNQTELSQKLAIYYCKRLGEYDPGHCA